MLLAGALVALFMTGFWFYCLTDAILAPYAQCPGRSKRAWIALIIGTFICGAVAWLIVRSRSSARASSARWTDADDAVARHPAGRARPADAGPAAAKGPDDDEEFLRALDRVIRGNSQAGGDAEPAA